MDSFELSEMSKFLALVKHEMSFEKMSDQQSSEILNKILQIIEKPK